MEFTSSRCKVRSQELKSLMLFNAMRYKFNKFTKIENCYEMEGKLEYPIFPIKSLNCSNVL